MNKKQLYIFILTLSLLVAFFFFFENTVPTSACLQCLEPPPQLRLQYDFQHNILAFLWDFIQAYQFLILLIGEVSILVIGVILFKRNKKK